MSTPLNYLVDNPTFRSFSKSELSALDRAFIIAKYTDGSRFSSQGVSGSQIHLLLEGEIVLTRHGPITNRTREVRVLAPGELFGLLSLVDNLPEATTAMARGDVSVASLSRVASTVLFNSSASIAFHFQLMLGVQLAHDVTERNLSLLRQLEID